MCEESRIRRRHLPGDAVAPLPLRKPSSCSPSDASGSQCELTNEPYSSTLLAVGEVRMVEAGMNPDVMSERVHSGRLERDGSHIGTNVFAR